MEAGQMRVVLMFLFFIALGIAVFRADSDRQIIFVGVAFVIFGLMLFF